METETKNSNEFSVSGMREEKRYQPHFLTKKDASKMNLCERISFGCACSNAVPPFVAVGAASLSLGQRIVFLWGLASLQRVDPV